MSGIDVGVGARHGRGDSGAFAVDLEETVEDTAVALGERKSALMLVVDELQNLDPGLLSALLAVQHQAGQRDWPFYVVAAGLPNLPAALNASQRYAEGLFTYRSVGALDREDSAAALTAPAAAAGSPMIPRRWTCCSMPPEATPTSFRSTDPLPGNPPRVSTSPHRTPGSPSKSAVHSWTRGSFPCGGAAPRRLNGSSSGSWRWTVQRDPGPPRWPPGQARR
ncbi:hypothetical protein OL239_09665 [Arthrobacter sp. ATA002]|uniref:hypothetical protein n=1 Tax=Arthrobacter sp. ATA002 TaxID=2991715 RepID=UPI0022A7A4D9|nr:hypothetical protein [Arthrobacter sp. ATA002]WAP50367.1 hypothetical protein OL239_09665 [Arthrobacter sp. ATA002]